MDRTQSLTLIVSLALLQSCKASDDPMALVSGSAASAVTDDGSFSAASLTLPFSGSYNGIPAAFEIIQTGLGRAGVFRNSSTTNPRVALTAHSAGSSNALYAYNTGTGPAGYFEITNPSSPSSAVYVRSNASPPLVDATSSGHGTAVSATVTSSQAAAGNFSINNSSNPQIALNVYTSGSGTVLAARTTGSGRAASFVTSHVLASVPTVEAAMGGVGDAGYFHIDNSNNPNAAMRSVTQGSGAALLANQSGSTGAIAVFQADEVNQARIDRNGTGFFNGGTQTGGADVAEAFEVEGAVSAYRPGDVLVISTRNDQRVARSTEAYSTRVIGVYATKPGVLLTERSVDDALDDMIPVGVVGIIPTRVSAENGAVRRGDILVTARTPGHAMRATPLEVNGVKLYPSGAILGKALQNFAGPGTGMIKVLVNVK
jgi:hypothetical protein